MSIFSDIGHAVASAAKTVGHLAGEGASGIGHLVDSGERTVSHVVSGSVRGIGHAVGGGARIIEEGGAAAIHAADDVTSGVRKLGGAAVKDIMHNPLGAIGGAVVAIGAAPVLPALAVVAGSSAAVAEGATRVTDATGITHDANDTLHTAETFVVTHPAEIGEAAAGVELVVAGAAVAGTAGAGAAAGLAGKLGVDAVGHMVPTASHPATSGDPNADLLNAGEHNIWRAFFTNRKGVK